MAGTTEQNSEGLGHSMHISMHPFSHDVFLIMLLVVFFAFLLKCFILDSVFCWRICISFFSRAGCVDVAIDMIPPDN